MIQKLCCFLVFLYLTLPASLTANDSMLIRAQIDTLCSPYFHGRGYVKNGVNKSAEYLKNKYESLGILPFEGTEQSFLQPFTMKVNTFPGAMSFSLNNNTLSAGVDYVVHPANKSYSCKNKPVSIIDLSIFLSSVDSSDLSIQWNHYKNSFTNKDSSYLLLNTDILIKKLNKKNTNEFIHLLPEGLFIIPLKSKPLWWVAQDTISPTIVYLYDSSIDLSQNYTVSCDFDQEFVSDFECYNVAGYIPGEVPDSFIVFTAHYDHLGRMGNHAIFPGANDNASGVAMMLNLASYFSKISSKYTIVFLAFSGEEAGLLGSLHFTQHPLIDLQKIKFLINLDLLGDASNGITVVNATLHDEEFQLLNHIHNDNINSNQQLSDFKILSRGPAANSDHYPFSQLGVPAFFIYANGGKGYYHDTWDIPSNLSLTNIVYLQNLIKQFSERL